jgi:hypothetical protein
MEKVEVIYEVEWTNAGWHLIPMSRQAAQTRPIVQSA